MYRRAYAVRHTFYRCGFGHKQRNDRLVRLLARRIVFRAYAAFCHKSNGPAFRAACARVCRRFYNGRLYIPQEEPTLGRYVKGIRDKTFFRRFFCIADAGYAARRTQIRLSTGSLAQEKAMSPARRRAHSDRFIPYWQDLRISLHFSRYVPAFMRFAKYYA